MKDHLHIIGEMLYPEIENLEIRYKKTDFRINFLYKLSIVMMLILFVLLIWCPEQVKMKAVPIGCISALPSICFFLYGFSLPSTKQQNIDRQRIAIWSIHKERLSHTVQYRTVSRMLDEGLTPEHIMRHREGRELDSAMGCLLLLTRLEMEPAEDV